MTHHNIQPAVAGNDERAGTVVHAWRQIPVLNTTIPQNYQDSPIIRYAVDGQLSVVHVQFAQRHREVAP